MEVSSLKVDIISDSVFCFQYHHRTSDRVGINKHSKTIELEGLLLSQESWQKPLQSSSLPVPISLPIKPFPVRSTC